MALVQDLTVVRAKHFTLSNGAASYDRVTLTGDWRYLYVYNRQATNPYYCTFTTDGTTPAALSGVLADDSIIIPPNSMVTLAINESGFGPSTADAKVHLLVGAFATQNVSVLALMVPLMPLRTQPWT